MTQRWRFPVRDMFSNRYAQLNTLKKKELIYMHITVLFLKEEIMLHIISRMHKCIKMKKCGLTPFTFKEKN